MKQLIFALLLGGSLCAETFEKDGILIDFSVDKDKPVAGEDLTFRFKISDTTSGSTINGAYPAVWIDPQSGNEPARSKIERFIQGGLFGQAELDLNIYYVITLNEDATISVVDPRFGVGGTKLLALVALPGTGIDWVLSKDESQLFVSVSDKIVVVDTKTWSVRTTIQTPATRLSLQPDGHYLWASDGDSTMSVIATDTHKITARIPLEKGKHATAFSDNNRYAYIASGQNVQVIDVHTLKNIRSHSIGTNVISLAWSKLAQALYASGDAVVVLDEKEIIQRIPAKSTLSQIRFAPGDRFAFALSPATNQVHIFDASSNQIIQSGDTLAHPVQVAFSDEMAYISHRDTAEITAIPLAQIENEFSAATITGGQIPPGEASFADRIVQAPGANAVLIANPVDQAIYFYKEGMAAPMGSFSNYSRQPLVVQVIDRSLKERQAVGTYETTGRLTKTGTYDVCFFLDSPRIVHYFELTIGENGNASTPTEVTPTESRQTHSLGDTTILSFEIHPKTLLPEALPIQIFQTPGTWRTKASATHRGDGVYTLDFTPERAGIFYANVIGLHSPQPIILNVVKK
jgi:DNA-binding beta-propeller fold protein YncE